MNEHGDVLSIEVDAKLVVDMANTLIYPAATAYLQNLARTSQSVSAIGVELDHSIPKILAEQINMMTAATGKLGSALAMDGFSSTEEHMQFCARTIRPLMDAVRAAADTLKAYVAEKRCDYIFRRDNSDNIQNLIESPDIRIFHRQFLERLPPCFSIGSLNRGRSFHAAQRLTR